MKEINKERREEEEQKKLTEEEVQEEDRGNMVSKHRKGRFTAV